MSRGHMESVLLTVDLESDIATENEGMMCAMCAVLRPNVEKVSVLRHCGRGQSSHR